MIALRRDAAGLRMVAETPRPEPKPGEALVRLLRAGVSSVDLAVARGKVPFTGTLGHEFVGVVEKAPDAPHLLGKRVTGSPNIVCGSCEPCKRGLSMHCLNRAFLGVHARDGCFAELCALPTANLVELPKTLDDDTGVFAQVVASAVHAAHVTRIQGKPFVTVLGDGPLGLCCAQIMTRLNASVRLLGTRPEKFTLCEKWGIKHRHAAEVGQRHDQDVVIDCTGSADGVRLALGLVRPRGKIVLKSAPAPVLVAAPGAALGAEPGQGVDLAPAVVHEIELVGARCGSIADGVATLARGEVDVRPLITRRARFADALHALQLASDPACVKVLLEFDPR